MFHEFKQGVFDGLVDREMRRQPLGCHTEGMTVPRHVATHVHPDQFVGCEALLAGNQGRSRNPGALAGRVELMRVDPC